MGGADAPSHLTTGPDRPPLQGSPQEGVASSVSLWGLASMNGCVEAAAKVWGVSAIVIHTDTPEAAERPSENSQRRKHAEQGTLGTIVRILCRDSRALPGVAEPTRLLLALPWEDRGLSTPSSSECRTFTPVACVGSFWQGCWGDRKQDQFHGQQWSKTKQK